MLRKASWEEALERAAEGFRRNIERHGPDSFAMLSCARSTNEMNYVGQKFTRVVVGTNNVDSCNRTCHAPPAWPACRRCSAAVAAPPPTRRWRTPT
ncbi:hypothetical protein GCM10020001_073760 [Nonomuraea salmonea]